MALANASPDGFVSSASGSALRSARPAVRPFLGLIDSVLVDDPVEFSFDGAIARAEAQAAWTWMLRDLAPDLIDPKASDDDPAATEALGALLPELLTRARGVVASASTSLEVERRLQTQLGGDEGWNRLPIILNALRCRALLEKARNFGRATNTIQDEAALGTALQSMSQQDAAIAPLLMMAAVGQVANPSRLITAVIRIAGDANEGAIVRAGFSPLIDAILAHAQNALPTLVQTGAFADMDLSCRAIDRFHRLIRAVNGYIELGRTGRWTAIIAALIKTASARVEPKLRELMPDINQSLRRARDGADRLDSDRLLAALNGVYLLATVRDCRDSLALNALFDQAWTQTGQSLELHITRNLDLLRENPADKIIAARLETGIKMAELRFNADYADVLRRARDGAERRIVPLP